MKLNKRILIYSFILGGIILVSFVAYSLFLLPGLYVHSVNEKWKKEAVDIHEQFVKEGSFKNINPINWPSTTAFKFTKDKETIEIQNAQGEIRLRLKDPKLRTLYENFYSDMDQRMLGNQVEMKTHLRELEQLFGNLSNQVDYEGKSFQRKDLEAVMTQEVEPLSGDHSYLISMTMETGDNYVIYMGITQKGDDYYITYLPTIIADFTDIIPVILQSLPMAILFIFLVLFFSSMIFSSRITNPIQQLARKTRQLNDLKSLESHNLIIDRQDEIGDLSRDISELYHRLKFQYDRLEEENIKRQVLLRAGSHQLRTPISGSLLLVDGMIENVGKFKNHEMYLKKLKQRLLTMEEMIEKILLLDYSENLQFQKIDVRELIHPILSIYQETYDIPVQIHGNAIWYSDINLFQRLLDNLISNAFKHGGTKSTVDILIGEDEIQITNTHSHIPEELLPNIMDPFVSKDEKGHGLGLYLANYDGQKLGYDLVLKNEGENVTAILRRNSDAN
ncbi:MAG: HAMP domain-containing sensor histidine kinase [Tissierellia bacterium]|nr:HAMP domain-containing sensor histidine kinase [Tissierellia bacterium]